VLDAGCGAGSFLRIAQKLGIDCQGVEPSEYAADVARSQNLKVFTGAIEEFAEQTDDKFDVITSHHVVEHVPNPISTLFAMRKLLAPGGYIWIAVPNAAYPPGRAIKGMWHGADLPVPPHAI
jgi:2-polyprenyl-3-methyl-5-hydroxy-6-metoxy-1,4-benzoquinol methylase